MQTTKHPYELLVRWDCAGRLSGAHAQFHYVTTDEDGSVLGEFVGAAEPVSMADSAGFPLSDILPPLQSAALAELDRLRAERDAALAACEVLRRELTAAGALSTGETGVDPASDIGSSGGGAGE